MIDLCFRVERVRQPNLRAARIAEARLHDSDNGVLPSVQLDRLADDRLLSAQLLPEVISKNCNAMLVVLRLRRRIEAALERNDAEYVEESTDRSRRRQSPRLTL